MSPRLPPWHSLSGPLKSHGAATQVPTLPHGHSDALSGLLQLCEPHLPHLGHGVGASGASKNLTEGVCKV